MQTLKQRAAALPGILALLLLAGALCGNPGVSANTPGITLLGGGILAIVTAACLPATSLSSGPVTLAALALLGWCLLCAPTSLAPYLSQIFNLSMAGFCAIVIAVQAGMRRRRDWTRGAGTMAVLSLVICAYGIRGILNGDTRLQATFTNSDCFSIIPMIGAMLSLGLASAGNPKRRPLWLGATTILSICIVLTGARAGLLGFAVAYLSFVLTLASSESKTSKSLIPLFLLPPMLSLLLLFALGTGVSSFDRWISMGKKADLSIQSRIDVTLCAPKTYLRRPLWGAGTGCFHLAYQQDRPMSSKGESYMNVAHDDYMQWLVETGPVGLILWLTVLLGALRTAWKSYQAPPGLVGGCIGATVGVATYQLFNFATPVPACLFWLAACLGLCCAISKETTSEKFQVRVAIPLLLAGLWATQQGWNLVNAQAKLRQANELEAVVDWEGAYHRMGDAQSLLPLNAIIAIDRGKLAHKAFVFFGKSEWLERERAELLKARQNSPRDLYVLQCYATFLERTQQYKQASEVIQEAHSFAPYDSSIRRASIKNKILLGDVDGATQESLALTKTEEGESALLASLLAVCEAQVPGRGVEMLRGLLRSRRDFGVEVGIRAAAVAYKGKEVEASEKLAAAVEASKPEKLTQLLQLSHLAGRLGRKDAQLLLLERIKKKKFATSEDEEIIDTAWQSWTKIVLASGDKQQVSRQLEEYLIKRPRASWARFQLSQILDADGKTSEARTALRNGLPYDADGNVRIALGDLYHHQKLDDIARGYYQDALPLTKNRAAVQARLDQLKSVPVGSEDLQTSPIEEP